MTQSSLRYAGLMACLLISLQSWAQGVFAPQDKDYTHLVDRWETLTGRFAQGFHGSYKAYERKGIVQFVDSLRGQDSLVQTMNGVDKFNLLYLRNDSPEWCDSLTNQSKTHLSWWGPVYKTQNAFLEVRKPGFDFVLNPVYYFAAGRDNKTGTNLSMNTRGVEVRGHIHKKIGFYSYFSDNQVRYPSYVDSLVKRDAVVPGEGFWKDFRGNGYDFFQARGYITFDPVESIHVQFGHDRNQIGSGYRSLILSDHSTPYTFLKVQTRLWRFQYTNLFAQMKGGVTAFPNGTPGNSYFPNKYMALHHLSINLLDYLNVGFFEGIMFGRDTLGDRFELAYLNPVIFYRSVEQNLGSPDNALVGADFRWNIWKRYQLYGQFVLDEFFIRDLTADTESKRNKYSLQLGLKAFNLFGVKNLDAQVEYNQVRPFTYTHDSFYRNWAHYNQPLAHPMGANLTEMIATVRYQPLNRLTLSGKVIATAFGLDSSGTTNGQNILLPYTLNNRTYGYAQNNGIKTNQMLVELNASYMLRHGLWIDATYTTRTRTSADVLRNQQTQIFMLALRVNIGRRMWDF